MDLPGAHEQRWDAGYFRQIGLEELADEDFVRIASGLSIQAPLRRGPLRHGAEEMGLPIGAPVAVGMIDARGRHVGTVGVPTARSTIWPMSSALLSCTMTTTQKRYSSRASGALLFGDGAGLLAK